MQIQSGSGACSGVAIGRGITESSRTMCGEPEGRSPLLQTHNFTPWPELGRARGDMIPAGQSNSGPVPPAGAFVLLVLGANKKVVATKTS